MNRAWLTKGAGWVGLAVLAGCFGAERPTKPPGSALWLAEESGELASGTQIRLGELGVREIFLQAAELSWSSGPRLTQRSWAEEAADAISEAHHATTKQRAVECWQRVLGTSFRG